MRITLPLKQKLTNLKKYVYSITTLKPCETIFNTFCDSILFQYTYTTYEMFQVKKRDKFSRFLGAGL